MTDPRPLLRSLFDAAVRAADPAVCVPPHLPPPPAGRCVVVGAGKASAAMAKAVEDAWPGAELSGLVVTRYGHAVACKKIEIVEAAHPVPDAAGEEAARRILEIAEGLGEGDLMLTLISGGASALLSLPADGLSLEDKRAVNTALLRSGAAITEMNIVRKQLSAIKGGRLAAAAFPAATVALMISDVPGDDPAIIGSGPTVGESRGRDAALEIVTRYGLELPPGVRKVLEDGNPPVAPDDPRLARTDNVIAARPQQSLEAAAEAAREAGFIPVLLGDALEGEAREVAREHAALARETAPGSVLISGGELTVTLAGDGGRGGPNTEYLLALAMALGQENGGADGIHAIAGDTDGVDGSEDNAGALIGPDTLAKAAAAGADPMDHLARNDAWGFFDATGDLLVTGPTLTNVNDLRAILVT